jgi:hypothetical protein
MQNHFSLQKVDSSDMSERFVILMENGSQAYESKPMPASHARLALHKLGAPEGAIESMIDRARVKSV